MSHQLPPSVRRQDWQGIWLMVSLTYILTLPLLIYFSWEWISNWGAFNEHWPYLWKSLRDIVFYHDSNTWQNYWQQIISFDKTIDFYLHVFLPVIASSILAYFVGRAFYVPGGRDRLRHLSGPYLYWYKAAIQHAKRQLKKEKKQHPKLGLYLHPQITIPRIRESGNLFVAGAQGTGKSVFIIPLVAQIIERGERAFIYDEKREYTGLFYQNDSTILLAPWDKRGEPWQISKDARNAAQAQLIAEHLITDSNDPIWSNGARIIFAGMIEILNHSGKPWGWEELAKVLSMDEVELNQKLTQYYPRAARFIAENSKTTQSFFSQLIASLGWIYTLAEAWPNAHKVGFSIHDWLNMDKKSHSIIIVQADKRFKDIGAPLASTLISLITSQVLGQPNSQSRELWLFLDELANLPKNDSLMEWMSLGRSKGCRIVAGTQSIAQIQQIYTERGADALLNMFTLFASMRLGAGGETATYTAKAFGERHVERPTSSAGPQGNPVTNWHHETQALVTPSDLVQLPQASHRGVEGYLLIPGWQAVYRLRWPISEITTKAIEHCPAAWLNHPSKKPKTVTNRLQKIKNRKQHAINECHK